MKTMKKSIIYNLMAFLLLFMSSTSMLAQNKTVNGVVKDVLGEPVIGAKVAVTPATITTEAILNSAPVSPRSSNT